MAQEQKYLRSTYLFLLWISLAFLWRLEAFQNDSSWIPPGDLLGSVTRVPYLEELYTERDTEKVKIARIVLKRLQTP